MKKIRTYTILLLIILTTFLLSCEKEESYDLNRPPVPTGINVSQGDTSVFISWTPVEGAASYLIVRGLATIAENISQPAFVDDFAPDTLTEYRVYAVNSDGWRSYRYASGMGYSGIPDGILPRPPAVSASNDNYEGCMVTWEGGRFAKSFNVYRGEELIAENLVDNEYIDYSAPVSEVEYRVKSVNSNGESESYGSAMGQKAFYFIDDFESDPVGLSFDKRWWKRTENCRYYSEGDPIVINTDGYNSPQSLQFNGGKIELICSWGGVPKAGIYRMHVAVKKDDGGFWAKPSFSDAEQIPASGEWTTYMAESGFVDVGGEVKLKITPFGEGTALIDDFAIEYVAPSN